MCQLIKLVLVILMIAWSKLQAQDLAWPQELYVPVFVDTEVAPRMTLYSEQNSYAKVFKAWERLSFEVHDSLIDLKQIANYYGADEPWFSTRISNHYADLSGFWLRSIRSGVKAGFSWVPTLRVRRGAGAPSHLQSTLQAGPQITLLVRNVPVCMAFGAAVAGYADTLSSFVSHWQSLGRRSEPGSYYHVTIGSSAPFVPHTPVSLMAKFDRRDLAGFSYDNFMATTRGAFAYAHDSLYGFGQVAWWQGAGSTVSEDSLGRLSTGSNLPCERREINGSAGLKGSPRLGLYPHVVYQFKRVFEGTRDLREYTRTSNAVTVGLLNDTTRLIKYCGAIGCTWIYEDHLPGQDTDTDPLKRSANMLDMRGLVSTMSHTLTIVPRTEVTFEYLYEITANRQDYPVADRVLAVSDDQDRIYTHHRFTGSYAPRSALSIALTGEYLDGLTNFINAGRSGSNRTDRQYKFGLSGVAHVRDSCTFFADGLMIARTSTLMFPDNQALIMPPYSRSFAVHGGVRSAFGFPWVAEVHGNLEYTDKGYWYILEDTLQQNKAYYAIDQRMKSSSVFASMKYRFAPEREVSLEGEGRFFHNGTYATWEQQTLRRGSLTMKGSVALGAHCIGEGYVQYVNDISRKELVYGGCTFRASL